MSTGFAGETVVGSTVNRGCEGAGVHWWLMGEEVVPLVAKSWWVSLPATFGFWWCPTVVLPVVVSMVTAFTIFLVGVISLKNFNNSPSTDSWRLTRNA